MTCIVAIVENDIVYMAGDRFITDGNWGKSVDGSPKIAKIPALGRFEFLLGVAGNGRACDVVLNLEIQDWHAISHMKRDDPERNVRGLLVGSIRKGLKNYGTMMKDEDGQDKGCSVLVGHQGMLFDIDSNFGVQVHTCDYAAIGSAKEYALGSLATTNLMPIPPKDRLMLALGAAQKHNITCVEPFDLLELGI